MTAQSIDPQQLRRIIIKQSRRAKVGHIGPALSIADLIAVLYGQVLRIPAPRDPERDRFVLSKGHAALALYAALRLKGFVTQEQLDTFCADGTLLGVHPEHGLPGVDFSTGSLGQGLSFGAGAALAARLEGSARRVCVLVSDAECNEGALWEAVMFAAHHRLSALTAIVDDNGQQAMGKTAEVLDLEPLAEKWRAFGWHTVEVDGHDVAALREAFALPHPEAPKVIIARTVCGKGVSFMEGQVKWHYLPLSESEYLRACAELETSP